MTITDNRPEIISKRPATISMGVNAGKTSETVFEVTYSDGLTAFQCATCGKEFTTYPSTFAHRRVHGKSRSTPLSQHANDQIAARISTAVGIILADAGIDGDGQDIAELQRQIAALERQVKKLKERVREESVRARKAEMKLTTVRRSLGI